MRYKFEDVARDGNGVRISGGTVSVYLAGTTTAASIYTTSTSATVVNSVTTASDGSFVFYVDAFDYGSFQKYKYILSHVNFSNSFTSDNISVNEVVTGTYTISTAKTFSYPVEIPYGVIFAKSGSGSIAINSSFDAGLYQVFSGFSAEEVMFGNSVTPPPLVREVYPQWWGAVGDDSTDCTLALQCALKASQLRSLIVKIPTGTYRFSSTLTIDRYVRLIGAGTANSILKKVAAMNATGLSITASFVKVSDLLIDGIAGNGGNGIDILGQGVSLENVWVQSQGNDGIRIGSDTGVNCNSWNLINVTSTLNTRRGLYIHDNTPDANAGSSVNLQATLNGEDGLRIGKAMWDTFIGTLTEGNTGWGVNVAPGSLFNGYHVFTGGDSESNTAGDFQFTADATRNTAIVRHASGDVTDLGPDNLILSKRMETLTYVPVITGSTAAGTGTYSQQAGRYMVNDRTVTTFITLVWSAHDGTGDLQVSLPVAPGAGAGIQVGSVLASNLTYTAGAQLTPFITGGSSVLKLTESTSGGALAVIDNPVAFIAATFFNIGSSQFISSLLIIS